MELQQIGPQHPVVKQVLALAGGSGNEQPGRFLAEGLWAQEVLLDAGVRLHTVLVCEPALRTDAARAIVPRLLDRADSGYAISQRTLARIGARDQPDGLVSVAAMPRWDPETMPLPDDAIALVADGIENPGNLGTIIRTMDAVDASLLVLTNRRTRLTHPRVFRGSHGTSVRIPSLDFPEPAGAIHFLDRHGFTTYLADPNATEHYRRLPLARRTALVVGNERYGTSNGWYGHGFATVTIPMLGAGDSLNVAVSASILLYEARAQLDGWARH